MVQVPGIFGQLMDKWCITNQVTVIQSSQLNTLSSKTCTGILTHAQRRNKCNQVKFDNDCTNSCTSNYANLSHLSGLPLVPHLRQFKLLPALGGAGRRGVHHEQRHVGGRLRVLLHHGDGLVQQADDGTWLQLVEQVLLHLHMGGYRRYNIWTWLIDRTLRIMSRQLRDSSYRQNCMCV